MPSSFGVEVELNLPEKVDFSKADEPLRDIAYFVQEQIKKRVRGRSKVGLERPYEFRGYRIATLSERTRYLKEWKGSSEPDTPLIDTGEMIDSIRFRRVRSNEYQLYLPSGRNARLGRIHQVLGASRKKIRRPFLGMTQNDMKFAQVRLLRWMAQIGRDIPSKYIRTRVIKY